MFTSIHICLCVCLLICILSLSLSLFQFMISILTFYLPFKNEHQFTSCDSTAKSPKHPRNAFCQESCNVLFAGPERRVRQVWRCGPESLPRYAANSWATTLFSEAQTSLEILLNVSYCLKWFNSAYRAAADFLELCPKSACDGCLQFLF